MPMRWCSMIRVLLLIRENSARGGWRKRDRNRNSVSSRFLEFTWLGISLVFLKLFRTHAHATCTVIFIDDGSAGLAGEPRGTPTGTTEVPQEIVLLLMEQAALVEGSAATSDEDADALSID
jgi:hypothetical protein